MTSDHLYYKIQDIMMQLRDGETGCPWDIQQTAKTLVPYTIEEAYEVAEAIHDGDDEALKAELGDLFFQIVFYAQIAKENGTFTLDDVIAQLCHKMITRHPHVFASSDHTTTPDDVANNWEQIKQQERAQKQQYSYMDDLPTALPALIRAHKIQKRAANAGFDWQHANDILEKIKEECDEVLAECHENPTDNDAEKLEEEIGDLLFAVTNFARRYDIKSEHALDKANRKFIRRFQQMEILADHTYQQQFDQLTLAQQENLWQLVKQTEI